MRILMLSALAAVASCATGGQERVNPSALALLEAREPTGETRRCLSLTQIDHVTAVDERTLLFRSGVRTYYVNKTRNRCVGATSFSNRFQYTVTGGQLCTIDFIDIIDSNGGFRVGGCTLGEFQRLALKDAPDADEPEPVE